MLQGLVGRGEEVVGVFLEELGRNPKVREQVGKTLERAVDAKRGRRQEHADGAVDVERAVARRLSTACFTKIENLQGSIINLSMKDGSPHRRSGEAPSCGAGGGAGATRDAGA
jgi:hypothetical protein